MFSDTLIIVGIFAISSPATTAASTSATTSINAHILVVVIVHIAAIAVRIADAAIGIAA
jgi:hypothetical protein